MNLSKLKEVVKLRSNNLLLINTINIINEELRKSSGIIKLAIPSEIAGKLESEMDFKGQPCYNTNTLNVHDDYKSVIMYFAESYETLLKGIVNEHISNK